MIELENKKEKFIVDDTCFSKFEKEYTEEEKEKIHEDFLKTVEKFKEKHS